jgi:hypothetical protein
VTYVNRIANGICEDELDVSPWSLKKFRPNNSVVVSNMMLDPYEEIECGTSGEWIFDVVCVGDNVIIIANMNTNE